MFNIYFSDKQYLTSMLNKAILNFKPLTRLFNFKNIKITIPFNIRLHTKGRENEKVLVRGRPSIGRPRLY